MSGCSDLAEEIAMKASVGDKLIVENGRDGVSRRHGFIVEVEHADGSPPYLVRWLDSERESLVFPAPGAWVVEAAGHR